ATAGAMRAPSGQHRGSRDVTGNMLDYTAHMSSIQAKYFNRDEEGKSGAQRRCGVQVGGSPGVRSHRHRAKMPFVLPIHESSMRSWITIPPTRTSGRFSGG